MLIEVLTVLPPQTAIVPTHNVLPAESLALVESGFPSVGRSAVVSKAARSTGGKSLDASIDVSRTGKSRDWSGGRSKGRSWGKSRSRSRAVSAVSALESRARSTRASPGPASSLRSAELSRAESAPVSLPFSATRSRKASPTCASWTGTRSGVRLPPQDAAPSSTTSVTFFAERRSTWSTLHEGLLPTTVRSHGSRWVNWPLWSPMSRYHQTGAASQTYTSVSPYTQSTYCRAGTRGKR